MSVTRVHHLNCGTLQPLGGRSVIGTRPVYRSARMVCHCLLVETGGDLVLVDTGFGREDIERLSGLRPAAPATDSAAQQLLRHAYAKVVIRPRLDLEETAARQVEQLGFSPADVGHVVLTHLDLDHAGGLAEFPQARVHVSSEEHAFATGGGRSGGPIHRFRYWPYQWAHGPRWVTYDTDGGESWFGFDGVRALDGVPGVLLVPLRGHSPGHSGVALRLGDGWLLHAGDAYFDHREIDPATPRSTPGAAAFQKQLEFDGGARRANRARLRELIASHGDEVEVLCSHDPAELDRHQLADVR